MHLMSLVRRSGAVRMAIIAQCPIVPIGVVGTEKVLPKGASKPKLLRKVHLNYGRPISYEAYKGMENDRAVVRKLTEELMLAIRELSGQELSDDFHKDPPPKKPEGGA
jgi:1-acyl-sn-glycerol-3-phosphate acyltransferase